MACCWLLLFLPCAAAFGQTPLELVRWGSSLESVQTAIAQTCMSDRLYSHSPPAYPLAGETEYHYLCLGYRYDGGIVDKVVFVFADNALTQIEARGGAVDGFAPLQSPMHRYLHFVVYDEGERYASMQDDAVWYLSPGAKQASLFFWSNPYLVADLPDQQTYDQSARTPPALIFGARMIDLLPGLQLVCPLLKVERGKAGRPSWHPTSQAQINCFGYEYAGFPRKLEVVFDNDKLDLVRILTGPQEAGRVFDALRAEHGHPMASTQSHDFFANGRVALQKDHARVLLRSETLLPRR